MDLQDSLQQELSTRNIPGATGAVLNPPGPPCFASAGIASVETSVPMRLDSLFRLGSVTKAYTALLILLLAEEALVDLDQPVSRYVSGLEPSVGEATLHHLLTHTGGVFARVEADGPSDRNAFAEWIRSWPSDTAFFTPGRIFSYSDAGFALAGLVAAEVCQRPYAEVVADRIFRPFGMESSTFDIKQAITRSVAVGHMPSATGPRILRPMPDNVLLGPAGGLYSNAIDLARLATLLGQKGVLDGRQLVSPRIIELMTTTRAAVPGSRRRSYGYGLWLWNVPRGEVVEHRGGIPGFSGLMRVSPQTGRGYVLLSNLYQDDMHESQARIDHELGFDIPAPPAAAELTALSETEIEQTLGQYRCGRRTIRVVVESSEPVAYTDGLRLPIRKIDGAHYVGMREAPHRPVVFVPDRDPAEKVEFLFSNAIAYRRVAQ